MWVIRTLLEEGYTIRGAVRSKEKGEYLRNYFERWREKVEWTVVPDISKDSAFYEAVKGVDAIIHTASPLPSSNPEPDYTIKPAVHGTVGILTSALKYGTNVKRIVLTSSCSAIINVVTKPTAMFDETNWADEAVQAVKEKGKDNPDMVKYRASKVLAERAAWEFCYQHKNEIGWDLVALNPPHPPLQKADSPAGLNSSMRKLWGNISQERSDDFLKVSYGYIDVRDVAAAHVAALQKEAAGGERIIIANGDTTYSVAPELFTSGVLQRGNPRLEKTILYVYNPEKGKRVLGIKYRSFEETLKDTLAEFGARAMPTVLPVTSARVLVTGANGYIAMWVIRTLLEQGYTVRGAVRSEEKGKHLKEYFSNYGDKVECFIILLRSAGRGQNAMLDAYEQCGQDGAFDEAVKGVDAIEHTASPLPSSNPDPNDTIKPAVQGTLAVLKSAYKYGSKVKRIVLTSSAGAIINPVTKPTAVFDETHWADTYVQDIKEKGKDNPDIVKYRASKVLAERAAWDYYNEHKGDVGWDLVALNPPLVVGPPLQRVDTPDNLNSSLDTWWKNISKEKPVDILKTSYGYIDVRDIAAAHVVALQKESAGGERIIVSNGNIVHSLKPELYSSGVLPRGKPDLDKTILFTYNPEKGKRILGLKYRGLEEMISDTLGDFEARGWLKPQSNA
ncbi:LOW QUALITY PROTEIN: hypothetical protein CVT25_004547 [Psilocybe cyanescens]|uniref:NAD-dependent epimerase/dehydratase domain-containing protein n=1 Tax=Psilocybe cyanescens TaxID=93625 RepID=A0A409XMG2_PSICY|nr:LOW QUALITY PROTEIN: hypothetical protein CVT25_004547 [Psilocybe cyanescens]